MSQEASLAITSARILVAVDICSSPPALVGYQTLQNLLPDAFLVLGSGGFLSPFLNGRQPMLEGVHVAWRPAFAFQSCHFVSSHVGKIHFPIAIWLWQSRRKTSLAFSSCEDATKISNRRVGSIRSSTFIF
jgi:hypothetical protein